MTTNEMKDRLSIARNRVERVCNGDDATHESMYEVYARAFEIANSVAEEAILELERIQKGSDS